MRPFESAAAVFIGERIPPIDHSSGAIFVRDWLASVLRDDVEVFLSGSRVTVPRRAVVSVSEVTSGSTRSLRFEIISIIRRHDSFGFSEPFRTGSLLLALCVAAERAGASRPLRCQQ
jgi:hypothetical protein